MRETNFHKSLFSHFLPPPPSLSFSSLLSHSFPFPIPFPSHYFPFLPLFPFLLSFPGNRAQILQLISKTHPLPPSPPPISIWSSICLHLLPTSPFLLFLLFPHPPPCHRRRALLTCRLLSLLHVDEAFGFPPLPRHLMITKLALPLHHPPSRRSPRFSSRSPPPKIVDRRLSLPHLPPPPTTLPSPSTCHRKLYTNSRKS